MSGPRPGYTMSSTACLSGITVPDQDIQGTPLSPSNCSTWKSRAPQAESVDEMLFSAAQGVLTMQELADYLHISPTTVYRRRLRRCGPQRLAAPHRPHLSALLCSCPQTTRQPLSPAPARRGCLRPLPIALSRSARWPRYRH